jgi:transcriptional regulator with XRE-family HTH domain
MGRKKKTVQSAIGGYIQSLRVIRGLSITELARQSGLNASVVTRVESGESEATSATLRKLEKGMSLPEGDLALIGTAKRPQTLRLVFPHTVMAAPLIPLALAGQLPDVSFSSFSQKNSEKPYWLPPKKDRGIDFQRFCDRENQQTFAGKKLQELLDSREADLMAGWSVPLQPWPGLYHRVAQVSFGISHLTLSVFEKRNTGDQSQAEGLGPKQLPIKEVPDNLLAFYPAGLESLVYDFKRRARKPGIMERPADFSDWQGFVTDLKSATNSEGEKQVGCFAWEPYLGWLEEELKKDGFTKRGDLWLGLFFAQESFAPEYTSFDLIVRNDHPFAKDWITEQRKKPDGLFAQMKGYVTQLQGSLGDPGGGPLIKNIANYLGMKDKEENVVAKLRKFDMELRFYD